MSRLYDRVLAYGSCPLPGILGQDQADVLVAWMPHCQPVLADNVTQYYFEGSDQEFWDWEKDFPNLAPPFTYMWLETRRPRWSVSEEHGRLDLEALGSYPRAWGALIASGPNSRTDIEQKITSKVVEDPCWYMHMSCFVEHAKGDVHGPTGLYVIPINQQGKICKRSADDGPFPGVYIGPADKSEKAFAAMKLTEVLLQPFLLTISFLHCKNVTLDLNEPPPKVSRKHARKHGRPLTKYYTLEIEPMKESLRTEGRSGEVGLQRALHICRGHFATYSEEKPLFGKHSGTFWKPQHVRGTKKSGEVIKDYKVKGPR